jgi:hypothetical protein
MALVQGSPEQALDALSRAVRRSGLGLGVVLIVCAAHGAAHMSIASARYEKYRCYHGHPDQCARFASRLEACDPDIADIFHEMSCKPTNPADCVALARYFERKYDADDTARILRGYAERCADGDVSGCVMTVDLFEGSTRPQIPHCGNDPCYRTNTCAPPHEVAPLRHPRPEEGARSCVGLR